MTDRQIVALNNLYAATIEVMEAFQSESVDSEMRKKKIACLLENFLMGSTTNLNIVTNQASIQTGSTGSIPFTDSSQNQVQNVSQDVNVDTQQESRSVSAPAEPYVSLVKPEVTTGIRYSEGPKKVGDDWVFKRLKEKGQDDAMSNYYYGITLGGETATFEFLQRYSDIVSINMDEILPPKVAVMASGSVNKENAVEVVTLEPGKLVKDGKSWKVIKPVIVLFK